MIDPGEVLTGLGIVLLAIPLLLVGGVIYRVVTGHWPDW